MSSREIQSRTRSRFDASLVLSMITLAFCYSDVANAQIPQVAKKRLGVDVVHFDKSNRLFGVVMSVQENGDLWMLVERKWLATTYPDVFDEFRHREQAKATKLAVEMIKRIDSWIRDRPDDQMLISFLEDEKKRIKKSSNEAIEKRTSDSLFVSIDLEADRVRNVFRQPANRKRIAGLAWQHSLSDVTTSSVTVLKRKLEQRGVDVERGRFDLSKELPAIAQSKKQWASKKALVEHALRDRIEFQGTGTMLIRAGTQPNEADLIGQVLAGGGAGSLADIGAQLGLPEFKKRKRDDDQWWLKATREAERDGFRGVLITRTNGVGLSSMVSVETHFFAMLEPGVWFKVTSHSARQDINQLNQADIEQLQENPQIKKVMDTVQGMGFPVDRSKIELAMKHGVATQKAIAESKSMFREFLENYSNRLDAPAVLVK